MKEGETKWNLTARTDRYTLGEEERGREVWKKLLKVCSRQSCSVTDLTSITHVQCTHTHVHAQTHTDSLQPEQHCQSQCCLSMVIIWNMNNGCIRQPCICGVNKRPVPERVQVCFQRTSQPTLLFWLWGPAWTHDAVITYSWDNFQYFHLRRWITNKWESHI